MSRKCSQIDAEMNFALFPVEGFCLHIFVANTRMLYKMFGLFFVTLVQTTYQVHDRPHHDCPQNRASAATPPPLYCCSTAAVSCVALLLNWKHCCSVVLSKFAA